ncbi:MAG: class I SAM-dependent RNA methyltransferase [Prolixibacteraceae bacterium]|nr:class I SAM-dependent RNA methyltransferase [Prolixibacteraceae bacterium]MBN2774674.1 class I SAM-dependent RNA methyltransferase [Prolixibacteraceae bacterium]
MKKDKFIAKTLAGLEGVLFEELKKTGAENISKGNRAVFFEGDKKVLYRANFNLRTALRILKQIHSFKFNNVDDFYKKCFEFNWDEFMNVKNSFAVYSTVFNSKEFRNSMFVSLKMKDAIVDFFRGKTGKRPNVDSEKPEIILNVHISENDCSISLDSSGESLHKRGYRVAQNEAPLSEILAAGMILLSGWKGESDFIDPMCGSGTLPIEAVLIATNTPPGIFRKEFAFEKWSDFEPELFTEISEEAEPVKLKKQIYASDISPRNIGIARSNARNAHVFNYINFSVTDFNDLKIKTNGSTFIINPPYGERLNFKDLEQTYSMIGERLKHQYPGNTAWILSSSKGLFNKIGLKYSEKHQLYNGALLCDFRKYDLFTGKRNG